MNPHMRVLRSPRRGSMGGHHVLMADFVQHLAADQSAHRDVSDVLSCDVLGVPCDTNGLAAWAAGRSKHEYTRSTAGDKAAALSPAAEAALEAYLEARDCATLSEWDAAHPPRLLHASALLEACAKRGHVTTAAAESLRHSFVRDHCRG